MIVVVCKLLTDNFLSLHAYIVYPVGGDQMTTAPARGSQRIMSNSEREVDRLQSLVGVLEAGIPRCASLWYVIDQSNFYVTCVNLTYTGLQASGKKLTCVCACAARDIVLIMYLQSW